MRIRGGEFSTGTMGNFQPELTQVSLRKTMPLPLPLLLQKEKGPIRALDTNKVLGMELAAAIRGIQGRRRQTCDVLRLSIVGRVISWQTKKSSGTNLSSRDERFVPGRSSR